MSRLRLFFANPYKFRTLAGRLLGAARRRHVAKELLGLDPGSLADPARISTDPAAHFRRREKPFFYFKPDEIPGIVAATPPGERDKVLASADAYMAGSFSFRGSEPVNFADEIDWNHSDGVDSDWRRDLNRLDWLALMLMAAHYSGDGEYASRAAKILSDWQRSNPPGSEPWRDTFETSQRINTLSWILFLGRETDASADDALNSAAVLLYAHARWTQRTIEYKTPNNHLLVEAVRLAQAGILYPEFAEARRKREHWLGLVGREVERQVSADGVHMEGSIFYHSIVLEALLELVALARLNDVELPEIIPERCRLMLRFLRAVRRPGGGFPQLGDGAAGDVFLRYNLIAAGKKLLDVGSAGGACNARTIWFLRGKLPRTSDKKSPQRTGIWRHGGYAVLSRRQGDGGSHLVFDCGPFGMPAAPGHGHADCLSLELWLDGLPLIVDSGTYTYSDERLRNAFRGTRAHNTIVVDGEDQTPVSGIFDAGRHARCRIHHAVLDGRLRLVDASHDGYRRLRGGVIHRRAVIGLGGDGWLVVDRLSGKGRHGAELLWHLHPALSLELCGDEAIARHGHQPALDIRWHADVRLEASIHHGEEDPPLGWVSFDAGVKQAADVLCLSSDFTPPAQILTLLSRAASPSRLERFESRQAGGGTAITCELAGALYTVLLSQRGALRFAGWYSDAAVAAVRQADGELSFLLAGGKGLEYHGQTMISLPRVSSGLSCELEGGTLNITGDCHLPLRTGLEGFDAVRINGEAATIARKDGISVIGK